MGLLQKSPYDEALTVFESRIVFELHFNGEMLSKQLANLLAIDKGYLSRVLAGLKKKKLLHVRENAKDRREKVISLTNYGEKKFQKIDRVSRERTEGLLASIGRLKESALVHHLSAAQMALDATCLGPQDISLRNLESGDLGWVIGRHGEVYFEEFGWNLDFEILVAEIALGFAKKNDPKKERAWIAEANGVRLGCVFLVKENDQTAKLRILLVDPLARGLGLGTRLVKECVSFARTAGYSRILLWTNDVLVSARKIYETQGFTLEKEEAHQSFGKKLKGQYWEKKLKG